MNYKEEIRDICTYHGLEGTSGYYLSEEQFEKVFEIIDEAYQRGLKENVITMDKNFAGFLKGDGSEFSRELIEQIKNTAISEIKLKLTNWVNTYSGGVNVPKTLEDMISYIKQL